jgi:3-methylfumaryl-CoA hydratase
LSQLYLDDLNPGQRYEGEPHVLDEAAFEAFARITGDAHPIHYDREYAAVEGHPDVLVHGPLQGAWLHQFVVDWAGPRGRVMALSWQNRARAFPESDLTFRGRVTEIDGDVAVLEVWEEDAQGAVLMPGTARVRLPRRP